MQNIFQISKVIIFDAIDSTNAYLKEQVLKGNTVNGMVVKALYQTNGRGQRGNAWKSDKESNLLFSIFYQPKAAKIQNQFYLNMAICLAITRFVESFGIDSKIKWSNDVLVNDKKISGILIENSIQGNMICNSIIGIGFNLNQRDFDDLPHATSLSVVLNENLDMQKSFNRLLGFVCEEITRFENGFYNAISQDYQTRLYGKDELKQFNKDGEVFTAKIASVDEYGRLIIWKNGRPKAYQFGEIKQMY